MQFTTATLVAGLAKAHGERRLEEKQLALAKPKLLIMDELGYVPLEPDATAPLLPAGQPPLLNRAMLITSNRSLAEWGTVFAHPVVATEILVTGYCTSATCSPFATIATGFAPSERAASSSRPPLEALRSAPPPSRRQRWS
ncbi:ATP-binding protein [Bradyrhizobium arachidis]|uniref:ATP-binding protein n=1 Tax=Bradyrhizobium arachidis TaxID=858423 RepID=UPI0008F3A183|nr:ATP-binding protein [Bradyrhizobium arachidis]SFV14849.1 IstB-like ATP binding protein [Bradyrhizobium arachidis]